MGTGDVAPKQLIHVHMTKIIIHETRVQSTWLSGSKSRCSISSRKVVLLNDGKKRSRRKLGALFKSIVKVALKTVDVIIALGALAELALLIAGWLGW